MFNMLTILMASLALLTTATARIVGFGAPSNITPGHIIYTTGITSGDIQKYTDVAVAFGLEAKGSQHPNSLGSRLLGSEYIGPAGSNSAANLTHTLNIPSDVTPGPYVLSASYFTLTGALSQPIVTNYAVGVKVAGATSSDLVVSREGVNSCQDS